MAQKSRKQQRDLVEEYRAFAKSQGYINQTSTGYKAVVLQQWLYEHIQELLEDARYKELKSLLNYYGVPRDRVVALMDYANIGSTIDWKNQEINDLASFIISTYMDSELNLVGGSDGLTFTDFTIDTIIITHMGEFVEHYLWHEYPHPTPSQLRLMVEWYRKFDISNSDDDKPSGGLWEWILQYGECSSVPYGIIMLAMNDALMSNNGNLIATYITPTFLRNQPLVTIDGDDTKLCNVWDLLMTAVETGSAYPDDLMWGYFKKTEKPDFKELYRRIYEDLLGLQKSYVKDIEYMIQKDGSKAKLALNKSANYDITKKWITVSMLRTIIANGDAEKDGIPTIMGLVM